MTEKKEVYRNPQVGQPLITTISKRCRTPRLEIRFCNLVNAYHYPNSPKIPRYSITCILDAKEHEKFLSGISAIEKNENVASIIKSDYEKNDKEYVTTGKLLIKFQGKDIVPVWIESEEGDMHSLELEDEIAAGEKVEVVYDILRYTKKGTGNIEHGISFKPTAIYYYPSKNKVK
jgi:hypothetical protein